MQQVILKYFVLQLKFFYALTAERTSAIRASATLKGFRYLRI